MRIAQLTYSYLPITGGADAYAEQLRLLFESAGHEVITYQRHTRQGDPGIRRLPRLPWPLSLKEFWLLPHFLSMRRRELAEFEVLVGHYPQYCRPARFHPRTIGLSHGVTWDDAPDSPAARHKKRWAQWAFEACARYVANDTFFLREMGLEVAPGAEGFREVAPGKWYVPNCVDERVFYPRTPDESSPGFDAILVPRNIYHNRGVDLAVAAFAQIARRIPKARMVVAGKPSQSTAVREVTRQIELGELEERVELIGPVQWERMPELYSAARITVIPSRCGEGTSLAALESMACGTPVVTTNAGGLLDVPALHTEVSVADLAEKLLYAWENAERLSEQQRAAALQRHSRERWEACWLQVVEDW